MHEKATRKLGERSKRLGLRVISLASALPKWRDVDIIARRYCDQ